MFWELKFFGGLTFFLGAFKSFFWESCFWESCFWDMYADYDSAVASGSDDSDADWPAAGHMHSPGPRLNGKRDRILPNKITLG